MTGAPAQAPDDTPAGLSASERIRYRLVSAGCRHHANDNIAAFVREGELDEVQAEVAGPSCRKCCAAW